MIKILERVDKKQKIIILVILILIISVLGILIYFRYNTYEEDYEIDAENATSINEVLKEEISTNDDKNIIVHIVGAVNNSGIVKLPEGSRIADAIEAAGGVTDEANLSRVNLAYEIEDGQKIYIPSVNDKVEEEYITDDSGDNVIINEYSESKEESEGDLMININKASASDLEQLPGIGTSIASRIVEYRNENGKFKTIEDIKNVKGVGDAKYNNIKDNIEV